MFDNLFSIESVFSFTIAITVSIAITIKVFKLNLTIKNKSHVVNGDGNNIEHNEFNFIMKETQCEFRSLSFFLGGTLLLLLPYCGLFINSALYSFSLMAPYFCVLGVFLFYGQEVLLIDFLTVFILYRRCLMCTLHHAQLKIHIILCGILMVYTIGC